MDISSLYYLIAYAYNMNVIRDLDSNINELNNLIENEQKLSFYIKDSGSFTIDFSDLESYQTQNAVKAIKKRVPVVEVIDLILEAIRLGIVTDVSSDYGKNNLIDYENNYIDICNEKYYYFKINSESFDDTIYKITFDKNNHDIKNKVEYGSRTSLFVDTLMKRIMAKYNVLLVKGASWEESEKPTLPLDEKTRATFVLTSDSNTETDLIENQLKVMVNYRDNFNNTSHSENVIDDIFVNLNGDEIEYGFFNIGKTLEEEPEYDVINDNVSSLDIDSLLRIRNLINDSVVKFNIFDTLRKNENTNLHTLIESRIGQYDKNLNIDPKIEFTITPLSIYCNHIVKKSATYKIRSINRLYADYQVDYTISYNPADINNVDYIIYGDGEQEILKKGGELVIAFDDVIGDKPLNPRVSSREYSTMLYGLNKHYRNDKYKNVYFLNDCLVKLINNNLVPYDGVPDSNTVLKSQVVRGEISGKYVYIEDAYEIEEDDILGVDLLDIDTKRYIGKEYKRECDICGHIFGAKEDVWSMYQEQHKLANDVQKRSCCDKCKGTILDGGLAILYSSGYKKYYFDIPNKPRYTEICSLCENPNDSFIYISPLNKKRGQCKICKKYYCPNHINLETNICNNCDQTTNKRDNISDKKALKRIKLNLDPLDVLCKDITYNYLPDDNALWVYVKKKNKSVTYYFMSDNDMKYLHLNGKYVKRGEE